jgi:hypothetical protein
MVWAKQNSHWGCLPLAGLPPEGRLHTVPQAVYQHTAFKSQFIKQTELSGYFNLLFKK